MNVIFILCDTLVRDKIAPYHLGRGPYGHIRTPNLERLARRAVTFDNHWINSAPCMPARRDLWSGRIEFPWRSWGPRESFDPDWTLTLRQSPVNTALFTDHANLFDVGAGNYHFFFDNYQFVRGHVNDHCATAAPEAPGRAGMPMRIYAQATADMDSEEKTFAARNLSNVALWLDRHARSHKPFFLCVDEFDPHWPLDPPEPYRSMYLADKSLATQGLRTDYKSSKAEAYTPQELEWLKSQCAGKITLVDRWLGEVFDRMDRHNLWADTMLILTTDHGEFVGEYGAMSKGATFSYPIFSHIPLIVHYPRSPLAGRRSDALTCAVDLHATVLDALGQPISEHCHGRSLLSILRGESGEGRDDVLYGWWGKGFYWTDGRRLLCKAPQTPGPLFQYGTDFGEKYVGLKKEYFDRYAGAEVGRYMPHTDRPVYRVPMDGMAYSSPKCDFDALFDLEQDPWCERNLFGEGDARLRDCCERLVGAMKAIEVPREHYQRLGLGEFL